MAGPSSVPLIRYDLASYGVVTRVVNATTFRAAGMVGQGDGTFQDYGIYVLTKGDRSTNPPHHERQTCAGYTGATGEFSHAAFTANLAVGDAVLIIHPSVAFEYSIDIASYPGSTTHNWEAAEQTVLTAGGIGVINNIHALWLDINALAGNIIVRLYHNINAVQRQVYEQSFSVAIDGPGLWIVNGSLAIHGMIWVSAQSDNALDNGQAIPWQYIMEAV